MNSYSEFLFYSRDQSSLCKWMFHSITRGGLYIHTRLSVAMNLIKFNSNGWRTHYKLLQIANGCFVFHNGSYIGFITIKNIKSKNLNNNQKKKKQNVAKSKNGRIQ